MEVQVAVLLIGQVIVHTNTIDIKETVLGGGGGIRRPWQSQELIFRHLRN